MKLTQITFGLFLGLLLSLGLVVALPDFESPRNISFGDQYGVINASHFELNGSLITDWSQVNVSGGGSGGNISSISGDAYIGVSGTSSISLAFNTTQSANALSVNTSDYWDGIDTPSDLSGLGDSQISSLSWIRLNNYPTACNSNETITGFGDTITCSAISIAASAVSGLQAAIEAIWPNLDTDNTNDVESGDAAGGDLGGTYPNPTVDDDSHTHNVANITGTATDLSVDLIEETELDSLAEFDTQIGTTGTASSSTFLRGDNAWATPTDTDTTYSNGTGLNLTSEVFSLLIPYQLPQGCSNGQIAEYNTGTSAWDCGADDAGAGGSHDVNISGDSGTGTITDSEVLSFVGGTGISTSVSGNDVTITNDVTDTNETTRVDAITADCGTGFVLQNITDSGLECVAEVTDTNTQLSEEQVEDFVGGMLGGTETLITVTYQDGTNDIDFVVTNTLSSFTNDAGFITTTLTEEEVEDFVGGMLVGTYDGVDVTYQDGTNDIDITFDCSDVAGTGIGCSGEDLTTTLGTSIVTGEITDDTILEADLDITNTPIDNYVLSYDLGTTGFTWVPDADTDTNANTICSGTTTYLDGEGNCDDISSVYEGDLVNEAGLYAALSDVSQFWEAGDSVTAPNEAYGSGWNGDTVVPQKDDIYDWGVGFDTDSDGSLIDESWFDLDNIGGTNEAGLYSLLSDVSLFLESLVDDTTPQLGGELDTNGNNINMNVSTAGNVTGVDCVIFNNGGDWCGA